MSVQLLVSLIVFIASTLKSIFDLFINPVLFKKNLLINSAIDAAKRKKRRSDISSTAVFVLIAIASGITIWNNKMTDDLNLTDINNRLLKI